MSPAAVRAGAGRVAFVRAHIPASLGPAMGRGPATVRAGIRRVTFVSAGLPASRASATRGRAATIRAGVRRVAFIRASLPTSRASAAAGLAFGRNVGDSAQEREVALLPAQALILGRVLGLKLQVSDCRLLRKHVIARGVRRSRQPQSHTKNYASNRNHFHVCSPCISGKANMRSGYCPAKFETSTCSGFQSLWRSVPRAVPKMLRSWPQAARISRPREMRTVVVTPRSSR